MQHGPANIARHECETLNVMQYEHATHWAKGHVVAKLLHRHQCRDLLVHLVQHRLRTLQLICTRVTTMIM